ncbi:MAG: hypothetical protein HC898_10975, partial [Phycisphaerales bacterium]|nr:hypothetical protein [Phycisphaerales bacterium]
MCGDLIYSTTRIAPGDTLPLLLEVPEKFGKVPEKALYAGRFDSQVWRVVMGRGLPVLHALQFHECSRLISLHDGGFVSRKRVQIPPFQEIRELDDEEQGQKCE